ncbi:ABC transporter permease [Glaciihabitans sp. UYNi722]|uniref:ABC transporter permease n=1 Tax=Glaciihabitans sp. UYNi722 TaxID=3156344 RepID=UPI0033960BE7
MTQTDRLSTDAPTRRGRLLRTLSFKRISAIYVFVILFVVFSIWVPQTFLRIETWTALLDSQAVTVIVAIGLVIALSAGAFDLAIGAEVGFGSIMLAWLLVRAGVPDFLALILAVGIGAMVGLVNGLLIVKVRIDSFIATLAMSSILLALIAWVSSSQQILGLPQTLVSISLAQVFGITVPVLVMLIVAIIVWYVLEKTPVGRRIYATGGNIEAARLAGVNVSAVVVGSLVVCGAISALGGSIVSSRLGTGDPSIGPAYLLPAFSAAFLGSTQFKGGRFNVWGTVVAVYVLATGVQGLQLAGAPIWIPDLFNGVALLIAVGLAKFQGRSGRTSAIRKIMRMDRRRTIKEIK